MKNKLLASILTACMLLTMLPTAALAAEAEAEPGTEQTAPVQEDAVTQPEEDTKGTEADPYSREDFSKMTRTEYIARRAASTAMRRLARVSFLSAAPSPAASQAIKTLTKSVPACCWLSPPTPM